MFSLKSYFNHKYLLDLLSLYWDVGDVKFILTDHYFVQYFIWSIIFYLSYVYAFLSGYIYVFK